MVRSIIIAGEYGATYIYKAANVPFLRYAPWAQELISYAGPKKRRI